MNIGVGLEVPEDTVTTLAGAGDGVCDVLVVSEGVQELFYLSSSTVHQDEQNKSGPKIMGNISQFISVDGGLMAEVKKPLT